MNGPQHFAKAEDLVARAERATPGASEPYSRAAQVHATLAHAAAESHVAALLSRLLTLLEQAEGVDKKPQPG